MNIYELVLLCIVLREEFHGISISHEHSWNSMNIHEPHRDVMRCHEVASGGGAGSLGSARSIGGRAMCIALLPESEK